MSFTSDMILPGERPKIGSEDCWVSDYDGSAWQVALIEIKYLLDDDIGTG